MFCPTANYWTANSLDFGKQNWEVSTKFVASSYVYRESGAGASYWLDDPVNYGKAFFVDANHQYASGRYNHRDGMNALYNDGHAKWVNDENGVLAKAIADWDDFFAIVDG